MAQNQSSPYGPNIRTGRGGAGNFVWQSDLEKKREEDPEAGHPATTTEALKRTTTTSKTPNPSSYVTTGRGGAGNYVTPSELASESSPSPNVPQTANTISFPTYQGRGGVGNFQAYSAEQQARVQKEQHELARKEDEVRKQIAEDVDSGLQKPPGAWIAVPPGRERE